MSRRAAAARAKSKEPGPRGGSSERGGNRGSEESMDMSAIMAQEANSGSGPKMKRSVRVPPLRPRRPPLSSHISQVLVQDVPLRPL